jgi:hypothetical protein
MANHISVMAMSAASKAMAKIISGIIKWHNISENGESMAAAGVMAYGEKNESEKYENQRRTIMAASTMAVAASG